MKESKKTIQPPKFNKGDIAYFYDGFEEKVVSGTVDYVTVHNHPTDYRYSFEEGDTKCEWEMYKTPQEVYADEEKRLVRQIGKLKRSIKIYKENIQFCKDALRELSVQS